MPFSISRTVNLWGILWFMIYSHNCYPLLWPGERQASHLTRFLCLLILLELGSPTSPMLSAPRCPQGCDRCWCGTWPQHSPGCHSVMREETRMLRNPNKSIKQLSVCAGFLITRGTEKKKLTLMEYLFFAKSLWHSFLWCRYSVCRLCQL